MSQDASTLLLAHHLKVIHPANPLEEAEAGEVCGCD